MKQANKTRVIVVIVASIIYLALLIGIHYIKFDLLNCITVFISFVVFIDFFRKNVDDKIWIKDFIFLFLSCW